MRILRIEKIGFVWHIDAHAIAHDRAKHYAEMDKETTYQQEYDYLMKEDAGVYEIQDWYFNNMNWSEIPQENKRLICIPKTPESPDDIETDEYAYEVFETEEEAKAA